MSENERDLGYLEGKIDAVQLQVSETLDLVRRLPCTVHADKIEAAVCRLDALNGKLTPQKRPSGITTGVTAEYLDRRIENTERTVLERAGEQLEQSLKAEVIEGVRLELDRRHAEEQRAAAERREAARREAEDSARQLAEQIKSKAAADEARWSRVRWMAGIVATLLSSGTVASWCSINSKMDADRSAVVSALKAQPAPVVKVVKIKEPAPEPAE